MSMKPKAKSKSKYSNGLPQFYSYKDKSIGNNYSSKSEFMRVLNNSYHKYKKPILYCVGLYFFYSWIFSPLFISSKRPNNTDSNVWVERKNQVKSTFLESWNDYVKHGWGYDVYSPVAQKGRNIGENPLGWIIVDSLDTLMLMDCQDELEDAKSWVDTELNYDINSDVNVFETTIRMLGGLLSAHYLSNDDDTTYLEKAVDLGNKLLSAFDTPSGVPAMNINLHKKKAGRMRFPAMGASTAEIATLQLEFKYLSNLTGEAYFWDAAEKVMQILDSNQYSAPDTYSEKYDGLAPIHVNQHTGDFKGALIRLGSRGDSYYEYLLKQYLQTDEEIYLDMYDHAYQGIVKHLKGVSYPNKYVYLGELPSGVGGRLDNKMDHLVCFIGGLFALGATNGFTEAEARKLPFWNANREDQLNMGKELAKTCYHMYHDTPGTGLSPEIVVFNPNAKSAIPRGAVKSTKGDFHIRYNDRLNLQRPETVETLYYLYKITGDIKYREWGWEIFENFVKYTKVTNENNGDPRYTSLKDCTVNPPKFSDNMESFWLAETLKYLYLLFDDETGNSLGKLKDGSLDKWDLRNMVFNTEAHPLPKFDKGSFGSVWERGVNPIVRGNLEKEKKKTKVVEKIETESNTDKEIKNKVAEKDQLDNTDDNVAIAESMKASGEKPVAKQPVAKSLDEQVKDVQNEKETESEEFVVIDPEHQNNKEVAEKMKASGEKPVAKQPVAKPLNEQMEEAVEELNEADKAVESKVRAEFEKGADVQS